MKTEIQDAEFQEVKKSEEPDLRHVLRDILTAIEKELPQPGGEISDLYIESKIIIKLAIKGYKICKLGIPTDDLQAR